VSIRAEHEDRVVTDALYQQPEALLALKQVLLFALQIGNGGFQL